VLKTAIAIILSSLVLGCVARTTLFVKAPLPIPDAPTLISIKAAELKCLADSTYLKLVKNKLRRDTYESRLISILKTTRGGD